MAALKRVWSNLVCTCMVLALVKRHAAVKQYTHVSLARAIGDAAKLADLQAMQICKSITVSSFQHCPQAEFRF